MAVCLWVNEDSRQTDRKRKALLGWEDQRQRLRGAMSVVLSDAPLPARRVIHGLKVVEGRNWGVECTACGQMSPIGVMHELLEAPSVRVCARCRETDAQLDERRLVRLAAYALLRDNAVRTWRPVPLPRDDAPPTGVLLARAGLDALAQKWWNEHATSLILGDSTREQLWTFFFSFFFFVCLLLCLLQLCSFGCSARPLDTTTLQCPTFPSRLKMGLRFAPLFIVTGPN